LKVLQDSIVLIGQMKNDISNLVTFFKGLSIMVEHVVKERVDRFVKHIQGDFSDDGSDAVQVSPTAKIGDFRIVDAEREFIYRTVVTIRAYFSLFADIAAMWIKMSVNNITPGLQLVDKVGRAASGSGDAQADMQQKVAELEAWSEQAVKDISEEAGKVCNFTFLHVPFRSSWETFLLLTCPVSRFLRDKNRSRPACKPGSTSTRP
jgi:hypothetical protein